MLIDYEYPHASDVEDSPVESEVVAPGRKE